MKVLSFGMVALVVLCIMIAVADSRKLPASSLCFEGGSVACGRGGFGGFGGRGNGGGNGNGGDDNADGEGASEAQRMTRGRSRG